MATLEKKKKLVEGLVDKLQQSDALYLVDYTGMSVADMNKLRQELRNEEIGITIYKNTLFRRALAQVDGYDGVEPYTVEQTAYLFASGDPSKPAKVLKKFHKEYKKPQFKAAAFEGEVFGEDQLDTLAEMKSKEELIGDIVGLLLSPAGNVVSALQAQGSNIAGAVKSIADKNEE